MDTKNLSPYINVDVKMSKRMLHALNRHEAICAVTGVKAVSEADIRKFLADDYGLDFAKQFKPEYMYSPQELPER